jgi:predicted nuclease of predicted toxin-antitoxin system
VSAPRFLVDENLSVLLPQTAHARGYEAIHINHYGLRQAKDWDILKIVAEEDWILVTNNAFEFRGRYQKLEVHPGVVFLLPAVPRLQQIELFSAALDVINWSPDMLNTALDVTYAGSDIQVNRYVLPK